MERDKRTGIEKMRDMVGWFNNCREAWLDDFTIPQLIAIYDFATSDPDVIDDYPDNWDEKTLKRALKDVR